MCSSNNSMGETKLPKGQNSNFESSSSPHGSEASNPTLRIEPQKRKDSLGFRNFDSLINPAANTSGRDSKSGAPKPFDDASSLNSPRRLEPFEDIQICEEEFEHVETSNKVENFYYLSNVKEILQPFSYEESWLSEKEFLECMGNLKIFRGLENIMKEDQISFFKDMMQIF